MTFNRAEFLTNVLGADGAAALSKAADRSEYLAQVIVPRTILAWLGARNEFCGAIPGTSGRALRFDKSEVGFTGAVSFKDRDFQFQDATIFLVAGAVAATMELPSWTFDKVRNVELERLGKSIDLMARVRVIAEMAKAEADKKSKGTCEVCGGKGGKHQARLVAGIVLDCRNDPNKVKKDEQDLSKKAIGEGTGQTAAPTAPEAPAAPTSSAPQQATQQRLPKLPGSAQAAKAGPVKLTRSEAARACPACALQQFVGDTFVGCSCFRALSKSVKVSCPDASSLVLSFGEGWSRPTVATLLESLGRK